MLINPEVLKRGKAVEPSEEGCLSFPEIYADVEVGMCVGGLYTGLMLCRLLAM